MSDALATCTHVFVRHDAVKKPLQQPYDGPYEVLKRNDKFYTVDIKGRHDTVSLDRLKPAHIDTTTDHPDSTMDQPTPTSTPTPTPDTVPIREPSQRVTRTGRHVHSSFGTRNVRLTAKLVFDKSDGFRGQGISNLTFIDSLEGECCGG